MTYREKQEQEIKTIAERTVTIRLSDADCERIARKAGRVGMSVGELLGSFIGDLIGGTYSHGSEEEMRAEEWFDRCGFDYPAGDRLLNYLLETSYDIGDFITVCDEIEYYKKHPKEYAKEKAEAKEKGDDYLWFEKEYKQFIEEYVDIYKLHNRKEPDMNKEVKICRKWYQDLEELKKVKPYHMEKQQRKGWLR